MKSSISRTSGINNSMSKLIQVIESIAMDIDDIPPTGHIPFTYAIVFNNDDFYIGCKYSNSRCNGVAHPSIVLSEQYSSSSKDIQERVATEPHKRFILAIGDKYGVTKLEKDIVLQLWDVPGRLNSKTPMGVPAPTPTAETKDKMSKARKGFKMSQEHKDNIGNANRGRAGRRLKPEERTRLAEYSAARAATRWTPERKAELIGLRAAGKSYTDIGKIMDIHENTVQFVYKRWVPEDERIDAGWPQERIDKVVKLHEEEGLSIWKISKILGCAINTVERKYNAAVRKRGGDCTKDRKQTRNKEDGRSKALKAKYKREWPQERIDQLISLRDDDKLSWPEIGKILKVYKGTARMNYDRHKGQD